MFKTHLKLNKEVTIIATLFTFGVILLLLNIGVLIPTVISVYTGNVTRQDSLPIDADIVGEAVDSLQEK